jgi:hypothetical protein
VTETPLPSSWRSLEAALPFDQLPLFHRAFLNWRGVPEVETMPLRRVSQRVEAELNKMAHANQLEKLDHDWSLVGLEPFVKDWLGKI